MYIGQELQRKRHSIAYIVVEVPEKPKISSNTLKYVIGTQVN
jgi:hypothetical protein